MSKKKSTVTSILQTNITAEFAAVFFRVGSIPRSNAGEEVDGLPIVSSIKFCRHAYGQGAQVDKPCYGIEFEGGMETLIVPADQYAQVTLAVIDVNNEATIPSMPED